MTDRRAPLVDTHCHLVLLEKRGLLDEALHGAAAAGVAQIITVGLNVDDTDRNRAIAERVSGVFFSAGWHPHEKAPPDPSQLGALGELLAHHRAVAVGEVGLDRYWRPGYHEVSLDVQRRSLRLMLDLALTARKPVIVHDRDAHDEVLEELGRTASEVQGVMHCFSGDAGIGRRCTELGYLISLSGIVTFPRSQSIQDAARRAPETGYLVETDAPFLAPVPHRGRVNLPAYVAATAAAVARLRGSPENDVAEQTSANARRLFQLPADDILPGA